jgi:hypothetical protein
MITTTRPVSHHGFRGVSQINRFVQLLGTLLPAINTLRRAQEIECCDRVSRCSIVQELKYCMMHGKEYYFAERKQITASA